MSRKLPPGQAGRFASLAALAAGVIFWLRASLQQDPLQTGADLHHTVAGARLLLSEGINIYRVHPRIPDPITGSFSTGEYPLPAYLLVYPLSGLAPLLASVLFVCLTTALLAWLLPRQQRLLLASYPAVKAFTLAQWSPLVTCAALTPWAAAFIACKPHVGLAILAAWPTRGRWAACLGTLALATALWPAWLSEWLGGLPAVKHLWSQHVDATYSDYFEIPLLVPGGFLLLAAALRWRTPAGRLLLAHACLPQAMTFDDQLVLGLVASTRRQLALWVLFTWLGAGLWAGVRGLPDEKSWRAVICLATAWLPALALVLRQVSPPAASSSPAC